MRLGAERRLSAPLLIAGAGIGGLTAALALARRGFAVHLFEREAALSETGAGLQLSPNAARILQDLGLEERLGPALGRPEALLVRAGSSGRVLVEMPLGEAAERRWGAPSWVAHRADLQAALIAAVEAEPTVTLELGVAALGCAQSGEAVSLSLGGREAATGALLVAADGVHSALRRQLTGEGAPAQSGLSAFRALMPADALPGALRRNVTGLWLGRNAHLVHYPLRGGTLVNLVAIGPDALPAAPDAGASREEVLGRFAGWAEPARTLISLPQAWRRWPLFVRPPERHWPDGRIVLLGDAAHAMPPFLAQGAAMAIEDAAVLARCLGEDDVPAALGRYRAERLPRVAKVQRAAARNATAFHLPAPFSVARDLALRAMGGDGLARRYDWLYGWRDG